MSRCNYKLNYILNNDIKYNSFIISKIINIFMFHGKKTISIKIIYSVLSLIKKKYLINPVKFVSDIINLLRPLVGLRKRKIGGISFLLPYRLSFNRSLTYVIHWLKLSINRNTNNIVNNIFIELVNTYNGISNLIKRKINYDNLVIANRMYTI